jgi:hypothetical protein
VLVVLHRVTGRLIEKLELSQDSRAEFDIVTADQGNAATKIFVDSTQGHQVSLLSVRTVAKAIAISDEALDCGCSGKSYTLNSLIGLTLRSESGVSVSTFIRPSIIATDSSCCISW